MCSECYCAENLLCRPQQQVLGLCTDGRLGKVLQDVWQLRRDGDLLRAVDCVRERHGYNLENTTKITDEKAEIIGSARRRVDIEKKNPEFQISDL